MLFFYSRNKEVHKHVSSKTGKLPPGGNYKVFNENWEACEDTISTLAQQITQGEGLCAWHLLDGKRTKKGTECIKAGLIIIDIDNQADGKDSQGNKIQQQ